VSVPTDPPPPRHARRIPSNSVLFDRVIPALFILFALLMFVIVLFSVGVLTGFIHYQ
jgi:hypothetical protein